MSPALSNHYRPSLTDIATATQASSSGWTHIAVGALEMIGGATVAFGLAPEAIGFAGVLEGIQAAAGIADFAHGFVLASVGLTEGVVAATSSDLQMPSFGELPDPTTGLVTLGVSHFSGESPQQSSSDVDLGKEIAITLNVITAPLATVQERVESFADALEQMLEHCTADAGAGATQPADTGTSQSNCCCGADDNQEYDDEDDDDEDGD